MTKRRAKRNDEYTFHFIRVDRYEVRTDVSVNVNLKINHPWSDIDDEMVFGSSTSLDVFGTSIDPDNRAEKTYEITFRSDESKMQELRLKDIRAKDANGIRKYRTYRGVEYPVYESPPGITVLERRIRTTCWTAWIRTAPQTITNMLVLLGSPGNRYVSIHERKIDRNRWIQGIDLQTKNPTEE